MKFLTKHFKLTMGLAVIGIIALSYVLYSLVDVRGWLVEVDTRVVTVTRTSNTDAPNSGAIVFVCVDAATSKVLPGCVISETSGTGKSCVASDYYGACRISGLAYGSGFEFRAAFTGYTPEYLPPKKSLKGKGKNKNERVTVTSRDPAPLRYFRLHKE
jgi:hypothetical protein